MSAAAERIDSPFAKACAYLNYRAGAKWAAYLAAVGTGLVYVALLLVLWLFVDLMVSRGRVPDYHELTPVAQERFETTWDGEDEATRQERLGHVGLSPKLAGLPFENLSPAQKDLVWEEEARRLLHDRVAPEAADRVFPPAEEAGGVPGFHRGNHGVLSLVVREQASGRTWTPLPWLARWNRWMWNSEQPTWLPTYLTGLSLIALVLLLVGAALTFLVREMAARATVEATMRLRRMVYHHTFRLGTLAIRELGPSEAVSLLTRHIEAIHDALFARLTTYFRAPIVFGLLLLVAFLVHPWLALAFLMFALVVWLLGTQLVSHYRRQAKQATDQAAERLTIIRESLMLMRLVKVYLMEAFNQARVERQLARYSQAQLVRHRGEAVYQPVLLLLAGACLLVLLYVGALIVLRGQLSVAGAVVMVTALLCLYRPLERWFDSRRYLRRGRDAAAQVFKFLERRGEVGQVVGAEFLPPLAKQIEFDDVSLRDPSSGRVLLDGVSLSIPAGQRVGLIGADNLEKHALVYLIPRLLDPSGGEVRVDQHNLRWVTLDSLRAQIGVVMMHNLVFHDTVANNIGCGDSAYTLPQIIEAAKVAHAHSFIQKLPQGYETPIGELGHSLPVSAQFLIALARAILRDPALLIIEEPETEMDAAMKDLLDDTLARALPGRTVIFLPHRISTIRSCDTLLLLHKGRLVAKGQHKELLAHNPLYRHLHYLEFNEMDEVVAG